MLPVYDHFITINRSPRYLRRYSREPLFDNEALRNEILLGRTIDQCEEFARFLRYAQYYINNHSSSVFYLFWIPTHCY